MDACFPGRFKMSWNRIMPSRDVFHVTRVSAFRFTSADAIAFSAWGCLAVFWAAWSFSSSASSAASMRPDSVANEAVPAFRAKAWSEVKAQFKKSLYLTCPG